jgi:hypothetical protein
MRIVETDNFNRDYPIEKFLNLPMMTEDEGVIIANKINDVFNRHQNYPRFWKVVENDYVLDDQPFEP